MAKITSSIKKENYKIDITSPSGNLIIADEPIDMGGKNLGFSPKELLASALAACSSATVKMYADRKGWDLEEVRINIELDYILTENKTLINRKLEFIGNLDDTQKSRLLAIANACPVHKILSNPIEINSQLEPG
ncbi:OsmC family protein [Gelidibacter japonicus]|uniref:OsmC family protein n=1 Tax=Gelidibacter japonicus TaxID=1962232 RepID=UPI002AFE6BCC|nr:OsmC family protein [Gelidibacter japonicus]